MDFRVLPSERFISTPWKGGTSTELFIHPPHTHYQDRDFQFRLSTATVEVPESDFTHLPGVSRKLMILEGEIDIFHDDLPAHKLKKFGVENFSGDRKTRSKGKCVDFNLMMRGNTVGELGSAHLTAHQIEAIQIRKDLDFFFCYLNSGAVRCEYGANALQTAKGDLLVIQNPAATNLILNCLEEAELVFVNVIL